VSAKLLPALDWMVGELQRRQELARRESKAWTPAERVLAKIEKRWEELVPQLEEAKPAVRHLLAESLHAQADRFTADADAIATRSGSAAPVDPHQLRIDGKQLRYTVELAQAEGVRFRASVLRRLKRLQDALGIWHDHVVLTTTAMTLAQEQRLAYLEPSRLREVMQLSAKLTRLAEKRMAAFCRLWRRQGAELIKSIRDKAPLDVRAVAPTDPDPTATDPDPPSITAPRTDLDPDETPAPTASASSTSATRPAE
jgi:CHAD domain-containing protein